MTFCLFISINTHRTGKSEKEHNRAILDKFIALGIIERKHPFSAEAIAQPKNLFLYNGDGAQVCATLVDQASWQDISVTLRPLVLPLWCQLRIAEITSDEYGSQWDTNHIQGTLSNDVYVTVCDYHLCFKVPRLNNTQHLLHVFGSTKPLEIVTIDISDFTQKT